MGVFRGRSDALRCLNMATVMFLNFKTRFNRHLHGRRHPGSLDFYHIRSAFSWSRLLVVIVTNEPFDLIAQLGQSVISFAKFRA